METAEADGARGEGNLERGPLTADAFLRHWALDRPDAVALTDAPNRFELGLGSPRAVSFAEADAIVEKIARSFAAHHLTPGDIVAVQLPNICEAPLIVAGAWRAGLVPCTLPILWRLAEINAAFAQIGPAAVICAGQSAVCDSASVMCQAAVEHLSVRYVFGLGAGLPDGVTPIDDWLHPSSGDGNGEAHAPRPSALGAHAPALMTWTTVPSGTIAVPRTHRELIEIGKVFVGTLGLSGRDVLLNTYPLSTVTAVGGQVVPWLLTGATLALHQPFDFRVFLDQCANQNVTYTAVPAPVIEALADGEHLRTQCRRLARVGCVWPPPHRSDEAAEAAEPALPLYDIHNLCEMALIVRSREVGDHPARLPLGKLTAPSGGDQPTVYLETRVRGSVTSADAPQRVLKGELLVRGSTVPQGPFSIAGLHAQKTLRPDTHGYLDTQIACSVDASVAERFCCERNDGLIQHGGITVAAAELDTLYADYPDFLDAAAFAIQDPVMGDRIVAAVVPRPDTTPSLESFTKFLGERQVAGYKFPDQLIIVTAIPRKPDGRILRNEILAQV